MHSIQLLIESLFVMCLSSLLISEMLSSDPRSYMLYCDVIMQELVICVERGFIYVSSFICENENFYRMNYEYETSLDTYNKLLHDNITKTYKHGSEDNISEINNENTLQTNFQLVTELNAWRNVKLLFLLKIIRKILHKQNADQLIQQKATQKNQQTNFWQSIRMIWQHWAKI